MSQFVCRRSAKTVALLDYFDRDLGRPTPKKIQLKWALSPGRQVWVEPAEPMGSQPLKMQRFSGITNRVVQPRLTRKPFWLGAILDPPISFTPPRIPSL